MRQRILVGNYEALVLLKVGQKREWQHQAHHQVEPFVIWATNPMNFHHKDKLKYPVNFMYVDQGSMQKQMSRDAYLCNEKPKCKKKCGKPDEK